MSLITPVTTKIPERSPHPPAWRWARLTEVAKLESGHTPSRKNPEYWGGAVLWLSLKDMQRLAGRYVLDTVDKPTMLGIENSSARLLPAGTVALCRTASVGKVAILGREMATSQDFVDWVCGPQLDPEYLYWALSCSSAAFDVEKQGSTHKTIYMPTLERLNVLLPPLDEQHRIAALLDKADAIRRKRQEAIALTEQLLRSTFLEMFGDPFINPKRWALAPLHELATIGSGVMKGRDYTGIETIELPYMRVANVQDGYLALNDIKSITLPIADVEKYTLRYGDILLTEGGDPDKLGRGAVWRDQIASCVHQNHIFRVHPDRKRITSEYLCALLGSSHGKRYFLRAAKQTTGIATINRTQLSEFPVLLPPLELQIDYSRFVAAHERLTQRYHQLIAEQDTLFQSLVQRAFSGQL